MKESRYVRLANTMLRVLRNARIPIFLHRKSNHIFTVWQLMVLLLVIRQYEGKSYRMFVDWLVEEAYYLRIVLQLSHIPHFTTLQKFTERITGIVLERIILSFIILTKIGQLFIGIDRFIWVQSNSFMLHNTIRKERAKLTRRRKYIKLSLTDDVLQQIIFTIN
jgi:hypothetical protein